MTTSSFIQQSPSHPTAYGQEDIINARNDFIRTFVNKGFRYLRRMERENIAETCLNRLAKHITGNEILIEYHLFESPKSLIPIVKQWRLVDN